MKNHVSYLTLQILPIQLQSTFFFIKCGCFVFAFVTFYEGKMCQIKFDITISANKNLCQPDLKNVVVSDASSKIYMLK
jgi:hypothetical protein